MAMDRLANRRPRPACQGGESGWRAKDRRINKCRGFNVSGTLRVPPTTAHGVCRIHSCDTYWLASPKNRVRANRRPRPASLQGPSGPLLAAGGNRPGIYAGSVEAANLSVPLERLAVIPVYGDPGLWTAAIRRPVNGPDRANQHQSNPFSDHRTRHECRAYHRLKPETGVNARPRNKVVLQRQPYQSTIWIDFARARAFPTGIVPESCKATKGRP